MRNKSRVIVIAAIVLAIAAGLTFWFVASKGHKKSPGQHAREKFAAVAAQLGFENLYSPDKSYKADVVFTVHKTPSQGSARTWQVEMSCDLSTSKDGKGKLWLKVKPLTVKGQGQDGEKQVTFSSADNSESEDPNKSMFSQMTNECLFYIGTDPSNIRLVQGNEVGTIVLEQLANLAGYLSAPDQMRAGNWQVKRNDFRFGVEKGITEQADCQIRFCNEERAEITVEGKGETGENKFTNAAMTVLNCETQTFEQANFRFSMKYADGSELSADMQARFTVAQKTNPAGQTQPPAGEQVSAPVSARNIEFSNPYSPGKSYKADISFAMRSNIPSKSGTMDAKMSCTMKTVAKTSKPRHMEVKPLAFKSQCQENGKTITFDSENAADLKDKEKEKFADALKKVSFDFSADYKRIENIEPPSLSGVAGFIMMLPLSMSAYLPTADQIQTGSWKVERKGDLGMEAMSYLCKIVSCDNERLTFSVDGKGVGQEQKATCLGLITINHKTGVWEKAEFKFHAIDKNAAELSVEIKADFLIEQNVLPPSQASFAVQGQVAAVPADREFEFASPLAVGKSAVIQLTGSGDDFDSIANLPYDAKPSFQSDYFFRVDPLSQPADGFLISMTRMVMTIGGRVKEDTAKLNPDKMPPEEKKAWEQFCAPVRVKLTDKKTVVEKVASNPSAKEPLSENRNTINSAELVQGLFRSLQMFMPEGKIKIGQQWELDIPAMEPFLGPVGGKSRLKGSCRLERVEQVDGNQQAVIIASGKIEGRPADAKQLSFKAVVRYDLKSGGIIQHLCQIYVEGSPDRPGMSIDVKILPPETTASPTSAPAPEEK